MTDRQTAPSMGAALTRVDGRAKVTGTAPYTADQPVDDPAYLHPVQATIAKGRIVDIDTASAEALDGVLAIITHRNAFRLTDIEDPEMLVLQSDRVAFRGQLIGAVVATTPEVAVQAAELVRVTYAAEPHDAELRADRAQQPDGVALDHGALGR